MTDPETPSPIGWYRRPNYFGHAVPAFEHALVADVMRAGLITCQPETRLRGVAQAMAANHVHALVLMDPGGEDQPAGLQVIYDVDVLKLASAGGEEEPRAMDAAVAPVTIAIDATAKDAAAMMHEYGTRHLIVLDEEKRPAGVVSSLDLAATLAWGVGPPPGSE
jgi:predicted transcriptional regulator